jgi:hypothetical protein
LLRGEAGPGLRIARALARFRPDSAPVCPGPPPTGERGYPVEHDPTGCKQATEGRGRRGGAHRPAVIAKESPMTDRRAERDSERRERRKAREAEERRREEWNRERKRRFEELWEAWRRNHPSEEEEGKDRPQKGRYTYPPRRSLVDSGLETMESALGNRVHEAKASEARASETGAE